MMMTGVLLLLRRLVMVTVTGRSMEPALRHGDRLLARRTGLRSVHTGQLVVLRWPGDDGREWMVKRVAAVPGEPVPPGVPAMGSLVPPGNLAVLGDNAAFSHDSRQLGLLPDGLLLGVVIRRLARPAVAQGFGDEAPPYVIEGSGHPAGAAGAPAPAAEWARPTTLTEER
jgi:signal peptidase I